MPTFTHVGLDALDYTPGTVRTEMSDAAFASLFLLPNFVSALGISEFGGGGTGVGAAVQQVIHYWTENRLNPRTLTDTTGGGQTAVSTSMTVSLADAAVLDVGYLIMDQAQSLLTAELIAITGISVGAASATLTIARGQKGTTAATHAASAVYEVVGAPVVQGSDLGRDMSRSPGIKGNTMQTHRRDVVVTGQMVELAAHGMIPGIPNQTAFQLHERFWEMLADWERSFTKGIGTPSNVADEYQSMWGVLPYLGYSSPVPNATSVIYNAGGATLSDLLVDQVAINIYLNGGEVPDAILGHPLVIHNLGKIFRDQLRLSQAEMIRGYTVDTIRTSIGTKPVKLLMSGYMPDPSKVEGVAGFLDLDRMAIVPFLNRFCFLLSAPTTKDAEIISVVMQMTGEFRNTGTDFGQTSQVARNFAAGSV